MQLCTPTVKARMIFFGRWKSIRVGSGNTSGSKLQAGSTLITLSPFFIATPRSSQS